jgi:hypothetical protein
MEDYCKETIFICDCMDIMHSIFITKFDAYKEDPAVTYLEVILENKKVWERCKDSFLYLLERDRKWGDFYSCTIFKPKDIIRLQSTLKAITDKERTLVGESYSIASDNNFIRFSYDFLNIETIPICELMTTIHMIREKNFLKRIKRAVYHIFGYGSQYGRTDTYEIDEESAANILSLINPLIENK